MESRIIQTLVVLGVPGVALGVFYLLLRTFNFQFSTIEPTWAAIIVILFLLIAGGVTFYALSRWAPEKRNGKIDDRLDNTLRTLSDGVTLINKLADQLIPFMTGSEPIPKQHRLNIEGTPKEIIAREHGQVVKAITAEDLAELPPDLLQHISVYEASARESYKRWQALYPRRNASDDPEVNTKTQGELRKVVAAMKDDVEGILSFLESCGFYLDDHYQHFRHVIQQLSP